MTELRLQYKADRLGSQHTKQSIRTHSPSGLKSKPPLARERFSPLTPSRRSRMTASGRARQVTFVVCGNRLERRVDSASFRRSCAANRPNKAIRLADMTYVETLGTLVP